MVIAGTYARREWPNKQGHLGGFTRDLGDWKYEEAILVYRSDHGSRNHHIPRHGTGGHGRRVPGVRIVSGFVSGDQRVDRGQRDSERVL